MERFTRQPSPTTNTPTQSVTPPVAAPARSGGVARFGEPTLASKVLLVLVILLAISFVAVLGLNAFKGSAESLVKKDQYQAVFLDNGQVYFGKLDDVNNEYLKLTDIYYLQVNQQVQPEQVEAGQQAPQTQPQISLAKLGNELHGPEDVMFILRAKVTFWENLKNDGQVVKAISDFQTGQQNGEQQNP